MSGTPSKTIECVGQKFDYNEHCIVRMLHFPEVEVTCEVCGATTKGEEYISGIYKGHIIKHGAQADVIEREFPWSCSTCGTEAIYAYFDCGLGEKAWDEFFGINKADKINDVGDA